MKKLEDMTHEELTEESSAMIKTQMKTAGFDISIELARCIVGRMEACSEFSLDAGFSRGAKEGAELCLIFCSKLRPDLTVEEVQKLLSKISIEMLEQKANLN